VSGFCDYCNEQRFKFLGYDTVLMGKYLEAFQ